MRPPCYGKNIKDEILENKRFRLRCIVFKATFNNISVISWRSALLVEETGIPGENHGPVANY
jgi:hypothetical protein